MDYIRGQERVKLTESEGVKERYTRIVIDLGEARTDEKLHIVGDYLAVAKMDGAASTTFLKLNHRNARAIYPAEIEKLYARYTGVWLTNAAEPGKELIIYVGGALSGEIKVQGTKYGVRDSSGSDINPCKEDGALYDELVLIRGGVEFSGTVYSTPKTSTDAVAKFSATSKKLRDVVIKNIDAANAVDIGLYHATPATFRAASFEVVAGGTLGFTQVDLTSLAIISSVAGNHAIVHVIGVEN